MQSPRNTERCSRGRTTSHSPERCQARASSRSARPTQRRGRPTRCFAPRCNRREELSTAGLERIQHNRFPAIATTSSIGAPPRTSEPQKPYFPEHPKLLTIWYYIHDDAAFSRRAQSALPPCSANPANLFGNDERNSEPHNASGRAQTRPTGATNRAPWTCFR